MNELIERLIRARERRNLSLIDISYRTNIRLEILSRLENGEIAFQPYPYIKAMLVKYAAEVGEPLADKDFESLHLHNPHPHFFEGSNHPNPEVAETTTEPRLAKLRIGASIVVLIGLATVAIYTFSKTSDSATLIQKVNSKPSSIEQTARANVQNTDTQMPPPTANEVFESRRKPIVEATPPAPRANLALKNDKHSLVIRTKSESCWVSITTDNRAAKEMTIEPTQSIQFNADSLFVITIGKVETTEILLNGKPVALPKRFGAIAGLRLFPSKD